MAVEGVERGEKVAAEGGQGQKKVVAAEIIGKANPGKGREKGEFWLGRRKEGSSESLEGETLWRKEYWWNLSKRLGDNGSRVVGVRFLRKERRFSL